MSEPLIPFGMDDAELARVRVAWEGGRTPRDSVRGFADFGPVERMLAKLRAADEAERADRKEWIEGVKRRLGLVEIGDEPALRYRLEMQVPPLLKWMTADVAPGALALPVPDGKRVLCD